MIRFMTAGESHGPALVGIIEGLPAGMDLTVDMLSLDMARRKMGYGRGGAHENRVGRGPLPDRGPKREDLGLSCHDPDRKSGFQKLAGGYGSRAP